MWRKTVLKRLCKYLPSSSDLEGLIEYDNEQFGAAADIEPEQVSSPAKQDKPAQTKAESAILGDSDTVEGELVKDSDPI